MAATCAAAYDALVRKADATTGGGSATGFGPTQFDIAVAAVLYGGEPEFPTLASVAHAPTSRGTRAGC